jgi:long-chain acyl-CoA synthetase
MLYGGAALDKETIVGFNNFGLISIQGYGLTETSPVLTAEAENRKNPGSAGFPLDNVEIKILHPDKEGIGEVGAKGPNIFLGYYNDKKKTDESFEDGWFKTGDYGYIDSQGFLFLTGRKKDIIVLKNGKNVYPEEIETIIKRLPYVKECMVYERAESATDTLLAAKIVYDPEYIEGHFKGKKKDEYQDLIFEDIKKINKDLASFKHIKKITVTDVPMDKTTSMKVKRYVEIKKELKK